MGAEAESLLINRCKTQITSEAAIKKNISDDETDKENNNNKMSYNKIANGTATSVVSSPVENNKPKTEIAVSEGLLPSQIGTDMNFKRKIVWKNAIGFFFLHLAGLIGVGTMLFGYADIRTTLYSIFLTISSGMGVTMGAHRLFTHRSYKAKTWLRVTLLLLHTLAGQNCLYVWVRDHRQHHKYSDTDADPHNATRGFFFSHVGWLMSKKHPKVIEYGKKIDMSDMEADRWVMFQKKYYKTLYFIFTLVLPTAVPIYFWNETVLMATFASFFARTVVQLNFTWCVNSVAHIFGNKPYDKNMLPVESKFVSFFAGGEGWHNYHHTFPYDYRAAELGMPFNLSTKIIDFLAKYGAVYDRKAVTAEMIMNRVKRTGDGSHPKYGEMPHEIPESELFEDNNNNELEADRVLRKYIVDKQQVGRLMMEQLEKYSQDDDLNNNISKNKDRLVLKHKDKQALNVCSA